MYRISTDGKAPWSHRLHLENRFGYIDCTELLCTGVKVNRVGLLRGGFIASDSDQAWRIRTRYIEIRHVVFAKYCQTESKCIFAYKFGGHQPSNGCNELWPVWGSLNPAKYDLCIFVTSFSVLVVACNLVTFSPYLLAIFRNEVAPIVRLALIPLKCMKTFANRLKSITW